MERRTYYVGQFQDTVYLEHYGRLGMKWGQHIFGKDPSDRVSKRDYQKGFYQRDKTKDFTIPKGTKLYRMSYNKSDSDSSTLYVTRTDMDRNYYKNIYSTSQMALEDTGAKKTGPMYEQVVKTTSDLKCPSEEKRKEVIKSVLTDPELVTKIGEDVALNLLFEESGGVRVSSLESVYKELKERKGTVSKEEMASAKELVDWAKKKGEGYQEILDKEDETSRYANSAKVISISKTAREAYAEKLKSMGYNATVDDYGRKGIYGTAGETSESLILLSPSVTTSQVSSKKVTSTPKTGYGSKKMVNDITYDAKVLGNKYSAQQLKVYGQYKAASALAAIGMMPLTVIPGGLPASRLVQNKLYNDAVQKHVDIEREKVTNNRNSPNFVKREL